MSTLVDPVTPFTILHCADLHLDRAFVERDLVRSSGARRAALRVFGSKPGAYGAGLLPLLDGCN